MMYNKDVPNRRRAYRWKVDTDAKIKLEGAHIFAACRIKDLNLFGMQVISVMRLRCDQFFKAEIILPGDYAFNVECWPSWHKTVEGKHICGVYFSGIDENARNKIYKYVYENLPSEMAKTCVPGAGEKEGANVEDKRIFQRFNLRLHAKFIDLSKGKEADAETVDVSAKGVGLRSSIELKPATPVEVWLDVPDKGEPIYTRGDVVWSKQEGQEYRFGINLLKADLMGLSRLLRV